jgi:hypothetical protein
LEDPYNFVSVPFPPSPCLPPVGFPAPPTRGPRASGPPPGFPACAPQAASPASWAAGGSGLPTGSPIPSPRLGHTPASP